MDKPTEEIRVKKKLRLTWFTGAALFVFTVVGAGGLIVSAYRSYAEGIRANEKKATIEEKIESQKSELEQRQTEALNNLDPDYRRAVYERNRGIVSPGEELLPIYGGNEKDKAGDTAPKDSP